VAGAGPAATTVTVAPTYRREAPDELGEALNCGRVGWGIAAMVVLNRSMVALAAPATSHPVGRLNFRTMDEEYGISSGRNVQYPAGVGDAVPVESGGRPNFLRASSRMAAVAVAPTRVTPSLRTSMSRS